MNYRRRSVLIVSLILLQICTAATTPKMIRVEAERLPDLNTARFSHSAFFAGGEIVVVGGHTDGFVPTPTAEYFSNGKWHETETVYTHDNGFSIVLRSGKVIIAGGHEEPLGIGQTFCVEQYDPRRTPSTASDAWTESGHAPQP